MIHGTLEMLDDRVCLRFELKVDHTVESVWRAVSEPDELRQWFPGAVGWTPEAGETFEARGALLEVTEVDAPNHLAWTYAANCKALSSRARETVAGLPSPTSSTTFHLQRRLPRGGKAISCGLIHIFAVGN